MRFKFKALVYMLVVGAQTHCLYQRNASICLLTQFFQLIWNFQRFRESVINLFGFKFHNPVVHEHCLLKEVHVSVLLLIFRLTYDFWLDAHPDFFDLDLAEVLDLLRQLFNCSHHYFRVDFVGLRHLQIFKRYLIHFAVQKITYIFTI